MSTHDLPPWLELSHTHASLRLDEARVAGVIAAVLAGEDRSFEALGVILADRETVLDLNRSFLQHDYPTDVLSFLIEPDDGASPLQGEIYIDLDTALERHAEFGATFEEEALRYIVHGLLHLIGYDDATEADKTHMHRLEDRYLQGR
ncbi:MAG: rRNA maturation RNase YbeY [Rhodothermales bacterium]